MAGAAPVPTSNKLLKLIIIIKNEIQASWTELPEEEGQRIADKPPAPSTPSPLPAAHRATVCTHAPRPTEVRAPCDTLLAVAAFPERCHRALARRLGVRCALGYTCQ